jgi:hypothetical protein
MRNIVFSFLIPWVVGVSWFDPVGLIFFSSGFSHVPASLLALVVSFAFLVISLVLFWKPPTINEKKFGLFVLLVMAPSNFFYMITAKTYRDPGHFWRRSRCSAALALSTAGAQYIRRPPPCSPFALFWPFCVAGAVVGTAVSIVGTSFWALASAPRATLSAAPYRPPGNSPSPYYYGPR